MWFVQNPSPFTLYGTGTYIIGHGTVAVVDPGPAVDEHVDAIMRGLGEETVSHIVVTHTHLDHSPGCRLLQHRVDAKTYGFGPHPRTGPDARGVEEGVDHEFSPDVSVRHGEVIEGEAGRSSVSTHPATRPTTCAYQLREERALLSGDHVMGWSTSVIVPPDGDMGAYMKEPGAAARARRPGFLAHARPTDRGASQACASVYRPQEDAGGGDTKRSLAMASER